jgi:hypothetical protein
VNFEMGLTTAQASSKLAGPLNAFGANGGPQPLLNQSFCISLNSSIDALVPQFEPPGGLVTPEPALGENGSNPGGLNDQLPAARDGIRSYKFM